jgi:hypothetical protein
MDFLSVLLKSYGVLNDKYVSMMTRMLGTMYYLDDESKISYKMLKAKDVLPLRDAIYDYLANEDEDTKYIQGIDYLFGGKFISINARIKILYMYVVLRALYPNDKWRICWEDMGGKYGSLLTTYGVWNGKDITAGITKSDAEKISRSSTTAHTANELIKKLGDHDNEMIMIFESALDDDKNIGQPGYDIKPYIDDIKYVRNDIAVSIIDHKFRSLLNKIIPDTFVYYPKEKISKIKY